MALIFWIFFTLTGLVAGFFAGILGIGGGFIIVPILYWIFSWQGYSEIQAIHQAIATSLCVMIFTTGASAITHALKKAVIWNVFVWITIGATVGAVLGPLTSNFLSSDVLKFILAIIELLIGVYLIFMLKSKQHAPEKPGFEAPYFYIPFGVIVAYIGSLVGIGGGIFIVPTLILTKHTAHRAVATSSMSIVPLAIVATLSYFLFAQKQGTTPFSEVVNIPALICLSAASIIASPIGARLCHKISNTFLRVLLGVLLITLGIFFFL
jgi:uncharacterized protein